MQSRDLEREINSVVLVRTFSGVLFVPAGIHKAWNVDSCLRRNEGTGGNEEKEKLLCFALSDNNPVTLKNFVRNSVAISESRKRDCFVALLL